jgi:hypothetical protein
MYLMLLERNSPGESPTAVAVIITSSEFDR